MLNCDNSWYSRIDAQESKINGYASILWLNRSYVLAWISLIHSKHKKTIVSHRCLKITKEPSAKGLVIIMQLKDTIT